MSTENHNHITREIRSPGECYSCDRYHAITGAREVVQLRNIIFGALESAERYDTDRAVRYLTQEAQARNINGYRVVP